MKKPDLNALVLQFLQHKLTLALAESCTCGLVAAQLAPATGVSEVLLGSVVTYHVEAKQKLLGVKKETLATYSLKASKLPMKWPWVCTATCPPPMCAWP